MNIATPSLIPNLHKCAILLDVDGTILDIAPTPREVFVPHSLRQTITQLSESTEGALALVSGRSITDLDLLFAPLQLAAVGGHGAEFRAAGNCEIDISRRAPLAPPLKRELAAVAGIGPGILVEDKGHSIALHFRLAPQLESAVRREVSRIRDQHPHAPIEILPGKSVIEIKQTGFNKGTGVRELMTHRPFAHRHPIFIGDDVTDESVFEIISEFDGLAFSVGRKIHGVDGYFEAPEEVRGWLASIAGAGEQTSR
jgi:trehalose 6-phosphate phosphatase